MVADGFGGRRVVSFESRRALEMSSLIERQKGVPIRAPSMREVASPDDALVRSFALELGSHRFDRVVLLTGVGTRALADAVHPHLPKGAFVAALSDTAVVARGPKPASVLRELGVRGYVTVSEPNTWREVLLALTEI